MPALFTDILPVSLTPLTALFTFAFGAVIGSFLNALLWRLRTGESVAAGRSYCPCCQHKLAAADLVPVVSYLLLGGKCRYCRKGIHPSYLLVEIATGLLFTLLAWHALTLPMDGERAFPWLLRDWYAAAVLVTVFVFDLRYMLIPRSLTLPATIILAFAGLLLGMSVTDVAIGMAVGGGFFWVQHALSRGRWIGGGDIHLGMLMGALLGWPLTLVALFLAYVSGAAVGVTMLALRKARWQGQIPFGTFLSAATLATMVWGDRILAWYLRLSF